MRRRAECPAATFKRRPPAPTWVRVKSLEDGQRSAAPPSDERDGIVLSVNGSTQTEPAPRPPTRRSAPSRHSFFQGAPWTFTRVAMDSMLLIVGSVAALVGIPERYSGDGELLVWVFPPFVLALLALWKLYRHRIYERLTDGLPQVLAATSLAAVSLIAAAALIEPTADPAPLLARAWLFGSLYVIGGRLLLGWAQRRARRTRLVAKPTLIVGAGEIGAHVEHRLNAHPELGLLPVGYLDDDPAPDEMVRARKAPVLGGTDALGEAVELTGARHVVLAFSSSPDRLLLPFVRECEARRLEVSLVPRLFESVNVHLALEHLGGLPLHGLRTIDPKGWRFAVKHVLDCVASILLLVTFSPVMLALALAVRLSSPGPVLFHQRRIGRDGRDFEMLKFRSMRGSAADTDVEFAATLGHDLAPGGIEGADRRTAVGRLMRSTSLDELPQLFNVLRGDMSLVGPRPERPEFAEIFGQRVLRYNDRQRVKSGITGWAQVHGLRGQTSLADRVEWDNWYVQNWSLQLDLRIVLMTLRAAFHRGS